ncbi:Uncharacterised protein [uncultured archaeon]|nr:Uncharacterised protein [uncultured archaeon]
MVLRASLMRAVSTRRHAVRVSSPVTCWQWSMSTARSTAASAGLRGRVVSDAYPKLPMVFHPSCVCRRKKSRVCAVSYALAGMV